MSFDTSSSPSPLQPRRNFLGKLGLGAATLATGGALNSLSAEPTAQPNTPVSAEWDMSWVDKLAGAQYKVAFDTNVVDDGIALDHAAGILDQFHEVYGTSDSQVRVVLVMRQLGTGIGFNDAMWERYPLDDRNKKDSTVTPLRRNPYWAIRPDRSPRENSDRLERLTQRGVIVLVCNVATTNIARAMARETQKNQDEVIAEFKKNLIPGATLVPSGVFAMVRAQNAGCAFMRAS